MTRVEERLFRGAALMKTIDADAALGCVWCFDDGESARADICERLVSEGLLVSVDEGLFPGMGQTYRLAPYRGSLSDFITERFGPDWAVCNRRTRKLQEQHATLVLRSEYAAAKREFDARARRAA